MGTIKIGLDQEETPCEMISTLPNIPHSSQTNEYPFGVESKALVQ